MQGFHNTVVLITGAASGFGKLLAEKLSAAGARLVLGDSNAQGLQRLQEDLTGDVIVRSCDVTDETQVQGLVRAAVSDFGRLDIAINNAGISSPMKSLIDTTEADMDLNFAVNAKGVFFFF